MHPDDVLPLWVAEMDVALAAPVADALHRATGGMLLDVRTDIPQRVAISVVYKLPFGKGQQFDTHNRLGNLIIGGWQAQT